MSNPGDLRREEGIMTLQGRGALVTGGSSGIGRAVALQLAQEGARLYIAGAPTDAADVQATVEALQGAGTDAAGTTADVADATDVAALVAAARAHLGPTVAKAEKTAS